MVSSVPSRIPMTVLPTSAIAEILSVFTSPVRNTYSATGPTQSGMFIARPPEVRAATRGAG